ncbi:hypothetical protein [Actinomadura sp. BRA 177]|uniref:hypothetical protein n=1 Tax=Actinomadura sp. BRA 177 TaxID=2745202 RepID=UPI0015953BCE|nr:hypothetical protein [Actinomadura sp. BRA 177]NVI85945.1 hypothetical protein [Actinomadura sp. BRA 177]
MPTRDHAVDELTDRSEALRARPGRARPAPEDDRRVRPRVHPARGASGPAWGSRDAASRRGAASPCALGVRVNAEIAR